MRTIRAQRRRLVANQVLARESRLRAKKTDTNPLLFRTNMEAGHGGKSGRFQRYRERAEEYAFVLDQST